MILFFFWIFPIIIIYCTKRNQKKWHKDNDHFFLSELNFKFVYRVGSLNNKPDALSRRSDYFSSSDDPSFSNTPFSVLRPENFVVLAAIQSSLLNIILYEYKDNSFYRKVWENLDYKTLPIPHPKIYQFTISFGIRTLLWEQLWKKARTSTTNCNEWRRGIRIWWNAWKKKKSITVKLNI